MGNIIPIPHGMFDGMQGQNYEIDGAISFALEVVGRNGLRLLVCGRIDRRQF